MSLVVAFDESMRGRRYLGAAAVYDGSVSRHVERIVRGHRLPPQSPFHAGRESDARRAAFLRSNVEAGLVRAWIYEAPFPAAPARRAIVASLAADAGRFRAGRIVLDQINTVQDRQDCLTIARVLRACDSDLPYAHQTFGSQCGCRSCRWPGLSTPAVPP